VQRYLRLLSAACVAWGASISPVRAAGYEEEMLFADIPVVFTASKRAEKATEAPATVYVVSKADIRSRGYANLKDVLRDLPGMETIENSFSEWGTEVPVRGVVGNNKIAVLLNGVRVNPPGGENFPFRADFSVRNAERIEIVYGPGSTLYGQDAISMLINVITAAPQEGNHIQVGAAGGSESMTQGWATVSRKSGDFELVAHVQGQKSDLSDTSSEFSKFWNETYVTSFGMPGGAHAKPERWDDGGNIFLKLSGPNNSLQLWHRSSSRSSSEGGFAGMGTGVPGGSGILYYEKEAIWSDRSTVVSLQNNQKLAQNLDLTSTLTYNRYEIDPKTRYIFPLGRRNAAGTQIAAGNLAYFDYKYGIGSGMTLEEKMSWSSEKTSVIGGMEFSHMDIIPKSTVAGTGADRNGDFSNQAGTFDYSPGTGGYVSASNISIQKVNNVVYQNVGAYLEGSLKATDQLKLIAGGRVDKNSRFAQVPFSPRASVVYSFSKGLTTKYIFSKAFVYPSPYSSFASYDNGNVLNVPNSKVEPEKATSNEINISYDTDKMSSSLSLYLNQQKNLIILGEENRPGINQLGGITMSFGEDRTLTQTSNAGKSTAKGVDFSNKLKFGKSSLWASYSYVDFEVDLPTGKESLNRISRNNVRAGATVSAMEKLLVTPSIIYRSRPVNLSIPTALKDDAGDPFEFNLHAVYSVTGNLDVFVDGRNLTDHTSTSRGVANPVLQEPMRVFAGVRLSI
jgi:outer membrane receptor for ferrienterochelin and colicin